MKNLLTLSFSINIFFLLIVQSISAQSNNWLNFTNGYGHSRVSISNKNVYYGIWNEGGVVRINLESRKTDFFNSANSELKSLRINDLESTENDVLWVAHKNGLSRFANDEWEWYRRLEEWEPNEELLEIEVDQDGNIWAIPFYRNSLLYFDLESWSIFDKNNSVIQSGEIYDLRIDKDNNIWFIQEGKIIKYDGTNWGIIEIPFNDLIITSFEIDDSNNLWIGTDDSGIYCFNQSNWKNYNRSNSGFSYNFVRSINKDNNGGVWVSFYGCGGTCSELYKFSDSTWTLIPIDDNRFLINDIEFDQSGNAWIGTMVGLYEYDGMQAVKHNISNSPFPNYSDVDQILEGNPGELWFTGRNSSIFTIFDGVWNTSLKVEADYITKDSKNTIWGLRWSYPSYYSIIEFSSPSTYKVHVLPDTINTNVRFVFDKNDNLLMGSKEGIWIYDKNNWTQVNLVKDFGATTNDVRILGIDEEGKLYLWGDGFAIFDFENFTEYSTLNSPIPSDRPLSVGFDNDNNIWVGFDTPYPPDPSIPRIGKFDGSTWTIFGQDETGIPNHTPIVIKKDKDGNMWFATMAGLLKYDGMSWTNYNETNSGLGSNYISGFEIDSYGNLWMGYFSISVYNEKGILLDNNEYTTSRIHKIDSYFLEQNYPNPFNPSTTIKYAIPKQSKVTLKVFDVLGRELATLINKEQPQGNYEVEFDGSELTSGIYFYRLQSGDFVETKKMILLK